MNRLALALVIGAGLLLPGCGGRRSSRPAPGAPESGSARPSGLHRASLAVGALEREFAYFLPEGPFTAPLPVVLYLHGHGGSIRHATGQGLLSSASEVWMDVAEREGFLVLYPQGESGPGRRAKAGWNDYRTDAEGNPDTDDIAFVRSLIDHAVDELGGDRDRVFVTGMSNGGHMTMRVAMELSDKVAAIAPLVANLSSSGGWAPPPRPVPVLMMHGTEDPLAPFEGGAMAGERGQVLSARATRETWARWNGLEDVPEVREALPDLEPDDDSTLVRYTREREPGDVAVVAYEMRGAGHTQPSRATRLSRLLARVQGNQNRDVEMAEVVWAFFRDRSR